MSEVHVWRGLLDRWRGTEVSDALADVFFSGFLGMPIAERREDPSTDGAEVFF